MSPVSTILYVIDIAAEVYIFILFARVLCSWIRVNPMSKV